MIYLVDLEYVETRYTSQWKTEFPQSIADKTGQDIVVIEGPDDIANGTTPGAFLDFAGTNIYKAEQIKIISQHFQNGDIQDGDHFVFADAWHPGILNLKYMLDLFQIDATIHGLWHAGSYDPQDFLGRLIGDKRWVRHTEYAMFDAIDRNYFASEFHIGLFAQTMFPNEEDGEYLNSKIVRTGWPMEYLGNYIQPDSLDGKMFFPTEIRVMLQDDNPKPTFWLTSAKTHKPNTEVPHDQKHYVVLPKGTNTFVWNNEDYLHGADFDGQNRKVLAVVKGWVDLDKLESLLDKSIEKYKDFVVKI